MISSQDERKKNTSLADEGKGFLSLVNEGLVSINTISFVRVTVTKTYCGEEGRERDIQPISNIHSLSSPRAINFSMLRLLTCFREVAYARRTTVLVSTLSGNPSLPSPLSLSRKW